MFQKIWSTSLEADIDRDEAFFESESSENPLAGHAAGGPSEVAVDLGGRGAEDMSSQAFALLAMPSEADKYAETFETEETESVRFKLGDTIVETVDDEVNTPPISSDTPDRDVFDGHDELGMSPSVESESLRSLENLEGGVMFESQPGLT